MDRDFVELVSRFGPPPSVILLTTGNTSTAYLKTILKDKVSAAFALITTGEPLVEIGSSWVTPLDTGGPAQLALRLHQITNRAKGL